VSPRPAPTVFLGSGGFAIPVLAMLAEHPSVALRGVVSAPARPVGRRREEQPTPVAAWAGSRGIAVLAPPRLRSADARASIAALGPSLLVLADYGQLVPVELLDLPRHGALNLHPSLLPRHRGAAPIQAAILAGDSVTGVSLMVMDAGLDSGPIVAQRRLALDGSETTPELEARLATLAAELLRDTLADWLAGGLEPRPQPPEGVTMTRPLRREDGRLDPAAAAAELERQVRAYQPWPGSYIETEHGRLVVWRARVAGRESGQAGGGHDPGAANPVLATRDGDLELLEVQPAGGRRMSGAEYLRGHPGRLTLR
jgi:methionyl-tRNA formyltransferase